MTSSMREMSFLNQGSYIHMYLRFIWNPESIGGKNKMILKYVKVNQIHQTYVYHYSQAYNCNNSKSNKETWWKQGAFNALFIHNHLWKATKLHAPSKLRNNNLETDKRYTNCFFLLQISHSWIYEKLTNVLPDFGLHQKISFVSSWTGIVSKRFWWWKWHFLNFWAFSFSATKREVGTTMLRSKYSNGSNIPVLNRLLIFLALTDIIQKKIIIAIMNC